MNLQSLAKEFGKAVNKPEHYLEIYTELFEPLREKKLEILEIGVQRGGSIKILETYFPFSTITGLDTKLSLCQYSGPRIKLVEGDQADVETLEALGEFDIVIDDGGHTMNQQQTSFKIIYPKLKENGIYIIEDLHTSYWEKYRDSDLKTTDFLKSLVDTLNEEGIKSDWNEESIDYPKYKVRSVSFYESLCVIKK